jgi:cytosine deaminase
VAVDLESLSMSTLILEEALLWGHRPPVDVAIRGGVIAAVHPHGAAHDPTGRIPTGGRVVLPGLVNVHAHLDKAFLASRVPNVSGTIGEARRRMKEAKATFTVEDVRVRAARALRKGIAHGVTAIRTHVDIDPIVGLKGLEALLSLRNEWRGTVDLQIVAFPQEGILEQPGTEQLMNEALRLGADVVGGHLSIAADAEALKAQTDIVFRLAVTFDRDIDVHVDLDIDRDYTRAVSRHADGRLYPDGLGTVYLAEKTIAEGYQGRVTASHLSALDSIPADLRANVVELLSRAGVAVVALPASNMYIHGRSDAIHTRRGVTRLRELRAAGVQVAVGTDNIRDPFMPFGNTDLLQNAIVSALACHLVTDDDFVEMLRLHTVAPARLMRLEGYGLEPGRYADLVVFSARSIDELLAGETTRRWVFKRGNVIAETEVSTRLHAG